MFGKGPQTRDLAGHLPYYVLRQASRRSWRIGQRQPVEVTFLAYEATLQADALALVAAKTRASLMVEGELPEEGLAALEGDGSDVYLALARRLADAGEGGEGRARSLEALFAEARRSQDEADELLAEEGWEDEAAVSLASLPFPVRSVPEGSAPQDGLPLFAGSPAPPQPAGAAPNGKVLTFEELAHLLRHRKPRAKPVPEGQLALFGS